MRGLLERAGLELDRIQAYSTFTMYSNLETRHRPRRTSNLLGVLADWGVRHARAMLVGGLVTGVALAVVNTLWPGWYDRPGFWVLLAVVTVVLLPVAGWNGRTQYRLNARRPENIVVFPSQWRTLLRREDPGIVVLFLHELSHVRHNDAGRRRVVRTYAGAGRFVAFFDAGMVFAAAASSGVQLLLFAVVAGCGVIGVRAASRTLPLVEELRADAEACRDEADRTALRAVLARLAARTPTRALDTRIRVLDAGWSAAGLGRSVRALALTGAGFALPVLAVFALVWSGALTVAPDL